MQVLARPTSTGAAPSGMVVPLSGPLVTARWAADGSRVEIEPVRIPVAARLGEAVFYARASASRRDSRPRPRAVIRVP